MKQKLMRHKALIMTFIRIFFIVLYFFSFTYGRFFISIFFFILSITDIFMKKAGMVFIDLCIAFLLDTAMNPALELYYQTEKIRFHVLESRYEQVVKETIPSLINDTEGECIDINSHILCDSDILCRKRDKSVAILFTTGNTGNLTGYAYCSDENAFQMLEEYDYYDKINEHWSVFKMYPLKNIER